jgi:hypothetical protein
MVIDGSPLHISGKATPFSMLPTSVVDLKVQQLDLSRYHTYLPQETPITFAKGMLSRSVEVHVVNAGFQPSIRLSGTMALDQVELHIRGQQETPIAWTRLTASIAQVDWAARQVTVHEVRADGVRVFVQRERDRGVSLAMLIRAPTPPMPPDTGASASISAWQYRIASLAIDNSEARLLTDLYTRLILKSNGRLNVLESPQSAPASLSGQVDPCRLFVVAPTLAADGIKDKGKTTRVDLSLK